MEAEAQGAPREEAGEGREGGGYRQVKCRGAGPDERREPAGTGEEGGRGKLTQRLRGAGLGAPWKRNAPPAKAAGAGKRKSESRASGRGGNSGSRRRRGGELVGASSTWR